MMDRITTAAAAGSSPLPTGASSSVPASDIFSELEQRLQGTESGETTVKTPDGGFVTTVPGANGPRIVSETNAQGETLTEAGYVSPTLFGNFLSSLFSALKADSGSPTPAAAANASTTIPSNGGGDTDPMTASVNSLIAQLNSGDSTSTDSLLKSFESLLQSSGLSPDPSGQMNASEAKTTLATFLTSALPALKSGELSPTGLLVNTTA